MPMSIGRMLRTPKGDSLLAALDKEITKPEGTFNPRKLLAAANLFQETSEEFVTGEVAYKDLADKFFRVFEAMFAPAPRASGVFHPSSLSGACERALYYELSGVPYSDRTAGRPDAKLQRIFDTGTWWHLYIQVKLYRAGVLEDMEVPVISLDLGINGRGDGLVKPVKKRYLLEIKTINSYQFGRLTTKPLESHWEQASIYAHVLEVEDILFLYIDKDTCDIKEIFVERNPKMVSSLVGKIRRVQDSVADKEQPERICPDKFNSIALRCKFCTHCFQQKP